MMCGFNGTSITAFLMDSAWKQIEEFEDMRDAEAVIDAGRTPLEWDQVQALLDTRWASTDSFVKFVIVNSLFLCSKLDTDKTSIRAHRALQLSLSRLNTA